MIKGGTLTHDDSDNLNNNVINDRNLSVRTKLALIEVRIYLNLFFYVVRGIFSYLS